jgi:hypothetical protein
VHTLEAVQAALVEWLELQQAGVAFLQPMLAQHLLTMQQPTQAQAVEDTQHQAHLEAAHLALLLFAT